MKTRPASGGRFALVTLVAAAIAAAAIPATARAKDEPKHRGPLRVAILPITNATQELSATKIMDDILREELKEMPAERATFLFPFDTEQLLSARNRLDQGYRIAEKWTKFGTLDSTAIQGLDSVLTVDAILIPKISEWENHRVPVIDRGSSFTTIGLAFACYDIRSKRLLWKKTPREQRFGQEIDPTSGSVNYDATGFIQNKRATDPPRYEDVAADLVRDAFKKFPQK
jgi:hypothetical protein